MTRFWILALALAVVPTGIQAQQAAVLSAELQQTETSPYQAPIQSVFKSQAIQKQNGLHLQEPTLLKQYYQTRQFFPVWSKITSTHIKEFSKAVQESELDGLNPADYGLSALEDRFRSANSKEATALEKALLDIHFSDTVLAFINDVLVGRVNPKKVHPDWFFKAKGKDPVAILQQIAKKGGLLKRLAALFPQNEVYLNMRAELKKWKARGQKENWPKVPMKGKKWEKGQSGAHIAALRARLQASGDLSKDSQNAELFDDQLETAVKSFQEQNGLNADGVVGRYTIEALNKSIPDRVKQLIVNMERYRWLPRDLGDRYLFVNIPDYKVRLIEKGKQKLELRGVVGNTRWRTPVFEDEMEFLVLNPRWNVPPKIAKKEMLPKVQKDPSYLKRANFSVYKRENGRKVRVDSAEVDWANAEAKDYFFSQNSGGGNSLGRIKFMFPNKHSVYIHDTPSKHLFKRDVRAYSHGCVRLENPFELAVTLLEKAGGPKWDMKTIKSKASGGEPKTVKLKERVPIYLYYLTAWVDEQGQLQFRKDIYDYDRKLARALKI